MSCELRPKLRSLARGLALLVLALAMACSDPERSNPFDPGNPHAGPQDIGFNAIAGNQFVALRWDELDYRDLKGVRVLRSVAGGADTTVVTDSLLPRHQLSFVDNQVENDVSYHYNLQFVLEGSPELPVAPGDLATPGQLVPWLDFGEGTIISRMSPDFRDRLFELDLDFFLIRDMQVNPQGTELWVLDGVVNQVARFDMQGNLVADPSELQRVTAFRFNRLDRSVWIATTDVGGTLHHFRPGGSPDESYHLGSEVTSLAVEYRGGSFDNLWIGTRAGKVLRIENGVLSELTHEQFVTPEMVETSGTIAGGGYVLDTGSKVLFHFTGSRLDWKVENRFASPSSLVVSQTGDYCWVADEASGLVHEIDREGRVLRQIDGLGGAMFLFYSDSEDALYVTGRDGLFSRLQPGGGVSWQLRPGNSPGLLASQGQR